ncbi:RNA polymerase sigma factor [Pelagicoccus sp. SDUM812003]|uniref:RNA polymerase sigma factor n=1 Tax=Pelagicoccus sp. SDUM812003 TaxID=3041267 RepID=UPI0028106386|nr:RNA polymerase sigma factor [Pelagicoccus sp. SDUM812003]MDQ8202490.1 RNA polymerase sigma factor [Pelagicoccus sp. SDUM812003]
MNTTSHPLTDSELIQQGRNYAYSFTRDMHDAEDLAQQAWMKLKIKYQQVKDRGLLFRAIRNLFIDSSRRAKIVRFEALESHDYSIGASESFGTSHDLDSVLSILTPVERQCVYLNYIEGYTAKEISARTGMPRGTVLSHTHRARKKLHAAFGKEFSLPEPSEEQLAEAS